MSQVAELPRAPLSPPPPVYLRSSPPPHPLGQTSQHPPAMPSSPTSLDRASSVIHTVPKRKPISISGIEGVDNAVMHPSPASPARIDNASPVSEASSALVEDIRDLYVTDSQLADMNGYPVRQASLAHAADENSHQHTSHRHQPSNSVSNIPPRGDSLRHDLPQPPQHPTGTNPESEAGESSGRQSLESVPQTTEVYQPLQYHHQPFQEHLLDKVGHRGSRGTIQSSDSSSAGSTYLNPGRIPGGPRPYSDYSDIRGRSPQLSPYVHARGTSSHSAASPDTRPLSYVDLMNVPYPQPAPASLNNSHLRASVGNSASLLSHKQTFDMYLANVKKTNDSGSQYEFAVFMVHAAQELTDNSSPTGSKQQEIGSDISKAELIREAKAILQRLADRSYPYAQYYLGDGLASGLFNKGKHDLDKSFQLFVAATKHGHAEAAYRAALCYEYSWGPTKNGAKAVQYYRQAASKNHPGAMLRLGMACLKGEMGLSKRYREGLTWLKRATESADYQYNAAPYELGCLHETGYGDDVFRDEAYAAQLFTKSADLGHAEASYRMGDAYEHGRLNCPRDPALSVHFYTGAATAGHAVAMMALCAWFMVGAEPILEKDEYEAYEWAKKAAHCSLSKAEYAVGYFTEMGIGCRRDPLEANVWYVRAADHGDERARHRIAAIRAAASGANPRSAARRNHAKENTGEKQGKGKRFGIF